MQHAKAAVVAALVLALPAPVAAQHWSFDARRIALGGVGSANIASELVAERRGYRTLVLPFGLLKTLGDLDAFRSLDDLTTRISIRSGRSNVSRVHCTTPPATRSRPACGASCATSPKMSLAATSMRTGTSR